MYALARSVQALGLAITLADIILFFFRNMTMMFLLKLFIIGVVTFYTGYFLLSFTGGRPGPGRPGR